MWAQIDAPQVIRDWLRTFVEGAEVQSQLPDGWSPVDGVAITVVGDGTPVTDRGWTRENVRVAVHGPHRPIVRDIAARIDGALLLPGAVPGVSVLPGPGLITAPDDTVGGFIASVTVRVEGVREEKP